MCGIVGAITFGTLPKKEEKIRQESIIYIGSELLQLTQPRGKDATGVSTLFSNGDYMGMKIGIGATEFIFNMKENHKNYKNFIKLWRENPDPAKIFLGHCRKSSVGNSYNNVNNHPIKVGDIIGIHNGTLTNHDVIFKKLKCKRDGEVDSEAIFRLLHHYSDNGTIPFTTEMVKSITQRLQGSYAVLAFSGNNPYQLAMFRDERPIEMMFVRPLKTMFIASEKGFLKTAMFRYNKMLHLYNTNFVSVNPDQIEFKELIDSSLAIFDLTIDVEEDTEIDDLCDWLKTPFLDKVWKSSNTNYVYSGDSNHSYHKKGVVNSKESRAVGGKIGETAKTAFSKKDKDKKNKEKIGMIWNRALNEYKNEFGIEDSIKFKAVEIDIIAKKVHDVKITDKKIKNDKKITSKVEVDMPVDTIALEKAQEFSKVIHLLKNKEELVEELELSDKNSLDVLPLHALANKTKKMGYKLGFYDGHVEAKKEKIENTTTDVLYKKLLKSQSNICILKSIVSILSRMVASSNNNTTENIIEAVKYTFKQKKDILSSAMKGVFSVGDLKSNTLLKNLEQVISLEQTTREKTVK